MRLLLVEDNARLSGLVANSLRAAGFEVDPCLTGEDAEAAMAGIRFDALVLDLGLPDMDGMSLLRRLRLRDSSTPVLILTARDRLADRVKGLDAGADDYLVKPFASEELLARLRALLRRPGGALGTVLECGNLRFDTVGRDVMIGEVSAFVPRRELGILELLMRRSGRVIAKELLEDALYGADGIGSSNSLEVSMSRLRKRLVAANAEVEIRTLRGVGYMLAPLAAAAA